MFFQNQSPVQSLASNSAFCSGVKWFLQSPTTPHERLFTRCSSVHLWPFKVCGRVDLHTLKCSLFHNCVDNFFLEIVPHKFSCFLHHFTMIFLHVLILQEEDVLCISVLSQLQYMVKPVTKQTLSTPGRNCPTGRNICVISLLVCGRSKTRQRPFGSLRCGVGQTSCHHVVWCVGIKATRGAYLIVSTRFSLSSHGRASITLLSSSSPWLQMSLTICFTHVVPENIETC